MRNTQFSVGAHMASCAPRIRKGCAWRSHAHLQPVRTILTALLVCVLAATTALTCACSPAPANTEANATNAEATNAALSDMTLQPITQVTDADPLLAFAANSSMAVFNGPDAGDPAASPESVTEQNLCYSPVSLYLACTLLGMGTQGTAQSQVLQLLGIANTDELQAESQRVRASLEETYGDAIIQVADSIWAGEGYAFTDSYLQQVQALGGAAFTVPFGTEGANQQISRWITEQTNGLLKPQISTELDQAAMLINTIYFKDGWESPFTAEASETAPFAAPGQDVQANYLRQEITESQYAEGSNFTAANLGFSGGSAMTFVRPNDGVALADLLSSAESVKELLALEMDFQSVDWWLPKFTTDSSLQHLTDTLRALGVTDVLAPEEPDAFAPMLATDGGKGFCVSSVQQDTRLALDENGVEAAAFTAIGITKMALAPETEPVEFKLDRPFFYYVTSSDGTVLFTGVVYNPNL